jgi:signal transduction histidine kinase
MTAPLPPIHSAAPPAEPPRSRWRFFGLQGQLIVPYAVLTLGLAVVGLYVVIQLVAAKWDERFHNQLYEASRAAADGMVLNERTHLERLRVMVNVVALPQDLAQHDSDRLAADLCPLVLNGKVEMLTALDTAGQEILTLTPAADGATCQRQTQGLDFSQQPLVSNILTHHTDAQGDKYAAILPIASGAALFTSAPVRNADGSLVGVLLIGTRLETLLAKIKTQALADLVVLDANGQRLATTFPLPEEGYGVLELSAAKLQPLNLKPDKVRLNGREFQIVYAPLLIRKQSVGLLGVFLDSAYVVASQTQSRDSFIGLFLLGIVSVILVGYALSQSIIRPILRLRTMSQAVAAGQLEERSGLHRADEIGELAGAFDSMTDRLRERTIETERLYAEARQRNIELAEINARLQTAQQQLIQSEKLAAIGQLTAGIVHDVKNPLTVVMGVSELLRSDPVMMAKAAEELTLIHNSAQRANRIVSELMTFARQSTPEMRHQDLRTTLETATRLNTYLAREGRVKMTSDLPEQPVELTHDAQQIEQVLVNLIHNAIQAMPSGGRLTLRLRPEGEGAALTVQDTGVGIPPENLGRVFDPFFTTKPVGEGTGLGLSVTYGIVTRHHGRISVESVVGQGTTFTLWLPARQPEEPRPA